MCQSNYAHSLLALLTSRTRLKGKKQGGILLRFECKEGWLIKTKAKQSQMFHVLNSHCSFAHSLEAHSLQQQQAALKKHALSKNIPCPFQVRGWNREVMETGRWNVPSNIEVCRLLLVP